MDNPGQHLIHITNRGPGVFGPADVGEFKLSMKQPLKDINKFGMLHYSVPKTIDHCLDEEFVLRLKFGGQKTIDVPVKLPNLDYYNVRSSSINDIGYGNFERTFVRPSDKIQLDEILQSTINWSIMKHYDTLRARATMNVPGMLLARIGCVVDRNQETGCYQFMFGVSKTSGCRQIKHLGMA